jgi:hypothetical protein
MQKNRIYQKEMRCSLNLRAKKFLKAIYWKKRTIKLYQNKQGRVFGEKMNTKTHCASES